MAELIEFDATPPFARCSSTCDFVDIQARLADSGLELDHFDVAGDPADLQHSDNVEASLIEANAHLVAQLQARYHCHFVDAVWRHPDTQNKRFLHEHKHNEGEIRLFAFGSAWFYFPVDNKVYGLRCDGGDFVFLPAKMPHWFDAGVQPNYAVIRFFSEAGGWQASYSDRDIAQAFFAVHG